MGKNISKFCNQCFSTEEDSETLIPLIDHSSKSSHSTLPNTSYKEEEKIDESHPKKDYFFRKIEQASIEFLSHIRGEFIEEGLKESLNKPKMRVLAGEIENSYILKSEYFLECRPTDIPDLFLDLSTRKKWDENIEKIELVCNLPEETTVTYIKYKRFLLVSARDVVVVNRVLKAHNGFVYVSTSCEDEHYPEFEGIVRADVDVSGYYIEEVDEKICKVIGYTRGKAGGSLPTSVVKTATVTALPKFIGSLQKELKKLKR